MKIAFPLSKGCRGPWQQSVKVAQKIVKRGWLFISRILQGAGSSYIKSCVVCGGENVGKTELSASSKPFCVVPSGQLLEKLHVKYQKTFLPNKNLHPACLNP